jgi:hypothetical protein
MRSLKLGTAEQLGISPTLVGLVPATMERITIAMDFLLDRENRLGRLARLANDDAFTSVLSLAPGAVAVAKSLASLSNKIIDTFLDDDERTPLLRFVGDFNLVGNGISDAYYVILGSRYDRHPLPRPLPGPPALQVQANELLFNERPVVEWSYVVLDVNTVPLRTRALGRGEAWSNKLDQATTQAAEVKHNPFAAPKDRRQAWEGCLTLLKEANTLLRQDPLYLPSEVDSIIQQAYKETLSSIFPDDGKQLGAPPSMSVEERSLLRVANVDELSQRVNEYAAGQQAAAGKLREMGLLA